jgi:subtilisin-like proprotein convertase family protein
MHLSFLFALLSALSLFASLAFGNAMDSLALARAAHEKMLAGESLSVRDKHFIATYFPSPEQTENERTQQSLDDNGGTFFYYSGPVLRIPPSGNGGHAQDTTVTVINVSGMTGPISDVQIRIDSLRHTWDSDLLILLQSPIGTIDTLCNRHGGSSDNFFRTLLSDSALNSIAVGAAPFIGSFRPDEPLSIFDREAPNGNWRLIIADQAEGDSGYVFSWRIQILTGALPPCTDSTITAPIVFFGNTCDEDNDCSYRPSREQLLRVLIPTDGQWTFSLCGNSTWDPYLFISSSCCDHVIAFDDDGCDSTYEPKITCLDLTEGTYFLNIESYWTDSCGDYRLDISRCPLPCLPPEGLTISRNENDAVLVWQSVPNAIRYLIYSSPESDDDGTFLNAVQAPDTNYVDINALALTRQYYHVIAECPSR